MSADLTPAIQVDGVSIPVTPHPEHEWVLPTADVATGYDVSEITVRRHKNSHGDELVQGKHWGVQVVNTLGGAQEQTVWTKRGVIRLGFFIRSERAKHFRDAAEDLVLRAMTPAAPENYEQAVVALLDEIRAKNAAQKKVATLLPKAQFADQIMDSDTLVTTTIVAKRLGTGAVKLNRWLIDEGILRRVSGTLVPMHKYQHRTDLFRMVKVTLSRNDATDDKVREWLKWTQKGEAWLSGRYRDAHNLLPLNMEATHA